jgi:hypothetical protein
VGLLGVYSILCKSLSCACPYAVPLQARGKLGPPGVQFIQQKASRIGANGYNVGKFIETKDGGALFWGLWQWLSINQRKHKRLGAGRLKLPG